MKKLQEDAIDKKESEIRLQKEKNLRFESLDQEVHKKIERFFFFLKPVYYSFMDTDGENFK